jgi:peptidyl-tRNA hydrolase, PTH1 family
VSKETWLVVGLGNPGEKYRGTRHNVGFRVLELLATKHGVSLQPKEDALVGAFSLEDREVLLLLPQTFMNESGRAIAPFLKYRQIPLERLLVISDDLDLSPGKLRLRTSGGTGGHHGLDSIVLHIQGNGFPRLRIGIGKPPSPEAGAEHVLASFRPEERPLIDQAVERAGEGIELFILKGPEAAMREVNKDLPPA